jgi:hypothetical protein
VNLNEVIEVDVMAVPNRDEDFEEPAEEGLRSSKFDVALAARTSVPVLITGPAEMAFPIAVEIAVRDSVDDADGLFVVAPGRQNLEASLMYADAINRAHVRTVILRDVDAFDEAQQSALVQLMADRARSGLGAWRFIATTSVRLFDRVVEGSFNSRLFYSLNTIHIVV